MSLFQVVVIGSASRFRIRSVAPHIGANTKLRSLNPCRHSLASCQDAAKHREIVQVVKTFTERWQPRVTRPESIMKRKDEEQMTEEAVRTLFSVEGKIALVTGGTSGIGRMMAQGLVAAGAKVYVVARNEDDCARTAAELGADGRCRAIVGDLSMLEGIRRVARSFGEAEERLDILV